MRRWSFAKGQGTENDFVVLLDRDNRQPLGADEVRWICDRHRGIGADGVLRAALAAHVEDWTGAGDLWFMDYRNADGSIAEMCGNGIRVFVRYLLDAGLASGTRLIVATRDGAKHTTVLPDGRIRVAMGPATVGQNGIGVQSVGGTESAAVRVAVGNPHAVTFVDDLAQVDLRESPVWRPSTAFPDGVNLEFAVRRGPRHLAMRVHERGVGETRSCGTGTVAVAAAAQASHPDQSLPVVYRVDVPGGSVEVELTADQTYLTGPAVLVAHGELIVPDKI